MSATDLSTPPAAPTKLTERLRGASPLALWLRVAAACAILLGSAAVRAWQNRRIEQDLRVGLAKPRIDLEGIPFTLGDWKGEPFKIDPQIARNTGADQVVTRRYVNQSTGAAVDVILLYGPAVEMFYHIPEHCYPSAGFVLHDGPEMRRIDAGGEPVPFRSMVYAKGDGTQSELQEVYYTWWYRDRATGRFRWSPDIGNQKHFERIPSMYKVHVARPVLGRERREVGNPSEAFLRELMPEMARRLSASQSPTS
jgi:EpsI family protein